MADYIIDETELKIAVDAIFRVFTSERRELWWSCMLRCYAPLCWRSRMVG